MYVIYSLGPLVCGPHSEHLKGSMTCPGLYPKVWEVSLLWSGFWSCFSDFQGRSQAPDICRLCSGHEDWGRGLTLGFSSSVSTG